MNVGAVIVAAQDLTQDKMGNEELETFLPMLSLEGTTVIKREIYILRKAEISPIIVVGGYQAAVLKNHICHNGVIFVEDQEYKSHDWMASAQVGIKTAREQLCDSVLVIPVECPAYRLETIEKLRECGENTILSYDHTPGKIRLQMCQASEKECLLDVNDDGILYDITEAAQLEKARAYLKTKLVLSKTEDFFGPGLFHLLQFIDETGSIQAAAKHMGMSYSKCWKLLNRAEEQMGFPFLNRYNGGRHGGNSTITEEGREFMNRYHAMLEDIKRISQNFFDIYFQDYQ